MRPGRRCRQCMSGWVPGQVKTFDPTCSGCQDKKARGKRTGDEPLPITQVISRRKKLDSVSFAAVLKRKNADLLGRTKSVKGTAVPREAA